MSDSSDDGSESVNAHEQFHNTYGGAMAAWTRLEGCLFYWFMSATGLAEPLARAIFFSARSFTGRRDMLIGALPFAGLDEQGKAVLTAGIKKAKKYSGFRNAMAHREPVLDARPESPTWCQFILVEGRTLDDNPDAVTIANLATATRNFDELRRLLWDSHPMYRTPSLDVVQSRQLIRELPNQAQATQKTQIPEGT